MAKLLRVVWVLVALLTVAVFVASIFSTYTQIQLVCAEEDQGCLNRTSPEFAMDLQDHGITLKEFALYYVFSRTMFTAVYWCVAILIVVHSPSNPVALFVSLFLITWGVTSQGDIQTTFAPTSRLPADLIVWLSTVFLGMFFLLFPNGRFVPRVSRWLALFWAISFFLTYFFPESPLNLNRYPVLIVLLFCLLLLAQFYRYRRVSTPVERQQTRWVLFGTTFSILGFFALLTPIFLNLPLGKTIANGYFIWFVGFPAVFLPIPLSIAAAMLRSRLFDVDVLISKALLYGLLTSVLALVYIGTVILLQQALRFLTGQTSQAAVAISTLVIAALFTPLRRRIQDFIDRRFYRSRYDAAQAVAAFSAGLRDEVDLQTISDRLIQVAGETVQPAHLSLWLRVESHPKP